MAAKTERVKLGTSVIDALLHPPVVLARRFATLDQFSGGRVIAGVVAAMRACWGPDPVEYQGRFHRIAPFTREPLGGDRRPFLGGSPRQVADDMARLEPAGIDQVFLANMAPHDLEAEVGLLGEVQEAAAAAA